MEIQVRVNELSVSKVKVILPDNVRCPENIEKTNVGMLVYQKNALPLPIL